MELVLIGDKATKRTDYFKQAATEHGADLSLVEWNQIEESSCSKQLEGAVIKIDPPSYPIVSLPEMKQQIKIYEEHLEQLGQIPAAFFNTPEAIRALLDKRGCKARLQNAGVSTTQMIAGSVENIEELQRLMKEKHAYSVFLKPVLFSGAAGVTAFRMQPRTGKMQVFTSCKLTENGLVNTKTLYCLEKEQDILALLQEIFKLDIMVERWYPKSTFQNKSYDLRVVYQFGHIAHIVVRQAKGPITNLHLNNQALEIETLKLNPEIINKIESLCEQAVNLFPGLQMAGIDILLEKNSQKPYIIEMNGQGDLIYQDIYRDNRIYKEQIEHLLCKKQI